MKAHRTAIALAVGIAMGASVAYAAPVPTGGAFNMYSGLGLDQATATIAGQITVNVDTTITGFVDQAAGTWGVSSTTPFFGLNWTASGGTLIKTPGDYALNTTTGVVSPAAPDNAGTADGVMHFTVAPGQAAGVINFAWGVTSGIRVVDVWDINPDGSLTALKVPGMENGPFPGFNAAFNLTAPGLVPIPAAVWLFGSALVGVAGLMRRRKAAV